MKQLTFNTRSILDNGNVLYGTGAGLFLGFVSTFLLGSPIYLVLGIASGLIAGLITECATGYKKNTDEIILFIKSNQHLINKNQIKLSTN